MTLVGLVLVIKHRKLQEVSEEEVYLQNRILNLEEKLEFLDPVSLVSINGYDAILYAINYLNKGVTLGNQQGQFTLSIQKVNAIVMHIHYLTKLYENNSQLYNRRILFFHAQCTLIDRLKELFDRMKALQPAQFALLEWEGLHQKITEVQEFKEKQ